MFQDPGQPQPPPHPPLPCLKYILIVDFWLALTVSTVIATFSNIKCVSILSSFTKCLNFFPIDSEGCWILVNHWWQFYSAVNNNMMAFIAMHFYPP